MAFKRFGQNVMKENPKSVDNLKSVIFFFMAEMFLLYNKQEHFK